MHLRLFITAFILGATLLCLRVGTVGPDAIGLPNGTSNIFLDFTSGSATDGTATMTIGAAGVTDFHFTNNLGDWDCGPLGCAISTSTPDTVTHNSDLAFLILDGVFPTAISQLTL